MEDWQGDKCDVTLLEGVPVAVVVGKLDEALAWLRHSSIPEHARDALYDRLLLRKVRDSHVPLTFTLTTAL